MLLRRSSLALFALACGEQVAVTDAAAPDAGADVSEAATSEAAPTGWCGGVSCDWTALYCFADGVGQPNYGAGKCVPLPTTCTTDRTCACLVATLDAGCASCRDMDGGLIEGCWEP